ncbi:hypothetical protein KFK09_009711 [Dendrobium nobile]|uniref:Reverse transcriptase domain-containing protein n=1 Tax=Dendrobium nobile TaxID=94219 RepID=A0A8T3BK93_DENNO|nr:hypothetical protein KFK09_009711 [Dendrobium nobile]
MQELSSVGHFYTWHNQQQHNPIHIKLDRVLVNDLWLLNFPNSFYKVADPDCSDHSPLILVNSLEAKCGHRFLYKNYCAKIPEFWECLVEAFSLPNKSSPLSSFNFKLKLLKNSLKHKQWANANNLQIEIDTLEALQNSIITQIQSDLLDSQLNGRLKLINSKLAHSQTALTSWITQRAKVNWLTHGEDDLKFLYSKINIAKNYNRIKEITNEQGTFFSKEDIAKVFINHYKTLVNTPAPTVLNHQAVDIPAGNVIPAHLTSILIAPVTIEEIKHIVFTGKSNTAPGPDGFTFDFYKSTWNVIQHQLCSAVISFFNTGFMPNQTKATAIALIPKNPHASNVKDYRPIALCNVIYKIIAKIIANRMKIVMPLIIHPSQGGFIHKRIISDNILLATDILGCFNLKANQIFLCAKFDITKAFDMVSRDFLYDRLQAKGFPTLFISWIKACTSDVHFSICINGALEGFFNSSSGIRQGCPLSPYLFSIIMDGLSTKFDTATSNNTFKGIQAGNCEVSHLIFADDLLVFGTATINNAHTINDILRDFAAVTGLKVNPTKSSILISNNTTVANDICNILNIQQSFTPIKYLGLPMFYKKLNIGDFNLCFKKSLLFRRLESQNPFLS